MGVLESIYERYKDEAEFFVIYIREAHPSDGWQTAANEIEGIAFEQPKIKQQRVEVAQTCQLGLDISIPMLIDDMDNSVDKAYAAWPDRLYIVGEDGKIAYKGGVGPFGFKPREMEQALRKIINNAAKEKG